MGNQASKSTKLIEEGKSTELIEACKNKDSKKALEIIELLNNSNITKIDINKCDQWGTSSLYHACCNGLYEVVERLLELDCMLYRDTFDIFYKMIHLHEPSKWKIKNSVEILQKIIDMSWNNFYKNYNKEAINEFGTWCIHDVSGTQSPIIESIATIKEKNMYQGVCIAFLKKVCLLELKRVKLYDIVINLIKNDKEDDANVIMQHFCRNCLLSNYTGHVDYNIAIPYASYDVAKDIADELFEEFIADKQLGEL